MRTPNFIPTRRLLQQRPGRPSIAAAVALCLLFTAGAAHAQQPGAPNAPRTGSPRFTIEGGMVTLGDDLTRESGTHQFKPFGGLEAGVVVSRHLALAAYGQAGEVASSSGDQRSAADFILYGGVLEFRFPTARGSVIPLLRAKAGGASFTSILHTGDRSSSTGTVACFTYGAEAGLEIVPHRTFGVRLILGVMFTTSDDWDVIVRGNDNDGLSYAALGLSWYIPRLFH
jgi:hypothetical protein